MYKRCTFYTFFQYRPFSKTLLYQGCIKSCIIHNRNLFETLTPRRVLFCGVFRKEVLCKLVLYIICSLKTEKTTPTERSSSFFCFPYIIKGRMPYDILNSLLKLSDIIHFYLIRKNNHVNPK